MKKATILFFELLTLSLSGGSLQMDLTHIRAVGIFTTELPKRREAYPDYVRLE